LAKKNKHAQIFTTDIVIAISIFFLVLIATVYAWHAIDQKKEPIETRRDMELIAQNLAQNIISSKGNPENWQNYVIDPSNINSLGAALTPNLLSREKLQKLEDDSDSKYEEMKEILGVRGPKYEFYVKVIYDPGNDTLFGSNPVIAYTYGESEEGASEGDDENYGIRGYLDENDIEYTNFRENWTALLENIFDYNVAIFEDPEIDDSDVEDAGLKETLLNWTAEGNMFIQKEHGTILELFKWKYNQYAANTDGIIVALDNMIIDAEIGDEIVCAEGYRLNKNKPSADELIMLVREEETSNHALIAYQNYGKGKVYYFCDTQGLVYNISGNVTHDNIREIINFGGGLASYKFGRKVNNSDVVVKVHRSALLDDPQTLARVEVIVWQSQ
jgi:hypothetical protein